LPKLHLYNISIILTLLYFAMDIHPAMAYFHAIVHVYRNYITMNLHQAIIQFGY